MPALKRQHGRQPQADKADRQAEQPSKRLKHTHAEKPSNDTFAAIISNNPSVRKRLHAVPLNGVPKKSASKVDDKHAKISAQVNGTDDADDSTSEEDEEEEDSNDDVPMTNGELAVSAGTTDVEMVNGVEEEEEEPSFGELLRARHPDVIDVTSDPRAEASGQDGQLAVQPITGHSLATVLQQALKTNDKDLLERCFQMRDLQGVRNTIQRLPSPLVADLLARISERIYKRPGRTAGLLIWIQWSLVAHGGYLAAQPEVLKRLKGLNQIIRQRAQGLLPLVQLKGKLDLLSAQLELRRSFESQKSRAEASAMTAGVLYIEGDADDDWSANDDAALPEESIDDAPAAQAETQDAAVSMEDSDEDDSDVDAEDLLDIEAEDSDEDEEEDEDDEGSDLGAAELDDLDDDDSEEESEVEIKAPRPDKLNRKR